MKHAAGRRVQGARHLAAQHDVLAARLDPAVDARAEPAILEREAPRGRLRVDLPVRKVTLGNGLRLLLLPRRDVPVVAVRVHVEAGQVRERSPGAAAPLGAGAGAVVSTDESSSDSSSPSSAPSSPAGASSWRRSSGWGTSRSASTGPSARGYCSSRRDGAGTDAGASACGAGAGAAAWAGGTVTVVVIGR